MEKVIRVTREENLAMIADSIGFLRDQGKTPIFDAEHFFDGYRDDPGYALECVRAAVDGGAANVTLCDTNGGSLPDYVAEATAVVVAAVGERTEIGIHTHDDSECGVANSLAAVQAGARLVQGCINGYGERCGNANLASILPALQLKMGFEVVIRRAARPADLDRPLSRRALQPVLGPRPALRRPQRLRPQGAGCTPPGSTPRPAPSSTSIPKLVGNDRDILPSELGGKATIHAQAEQAGIELDDAAAARAVEQLKQREHDGYHYEAAPASFELLLRRESGTYKPLFRLESFRVVVEKHADGEVTTEATIKVEVDGKRYFQAAEGNGPVNALDTALRGAIADRYPDLADVELTNYKVRILDEAHGTGAVTRVLLDSADGEREWGTTGVSENIIEASWEALVDSLEYAFQ